MKIRTYLESVNKPLVDKLFRFATIQEAENAKAITIQEANQLAYMIAYGKQSNLFKQINS